MGEHAAFPRSGDGNGRVPGAFALEGFGVGPPARVATVEGVASAMIMILLCFIAPWLAMFIRGHILQGVLLIILHLTLIGWVPATIWALIVCRREGEF